MGNKHYVNVIAEFTKDGYLRPLSVSDDDGISYNIDKVSDIRRAASLKSGGSGIRYTCRMAEHTAYLFYEEVRWFIEPAP